MTGMHAAVARQREASRTVMAIDPGPVQSAWLVWLDGVSSFGISANGDVLQFIRGWNGVRVIVIEQVRSFGMAVGAEVLDTVHWSGRFHEAADGDGKDVVLIPRLQVKMHLCHDSRAKDANVRTALIDRYGGPDAIRKGGALQGVSKDVWSALALAVTYADGVR